ncbi:MAG: class I SAM-dependent methyltransferase [Cyanobacteria bacterium P01_D01_bin.128]
MGRCRTILSWAVGLCLLLGTTACGGSSILTGLAGSADYTYRTASTDGIGKIYLGREIAQVMGHRGAYWLERPSRSMQERPEAAIAALELPSDATVADIGAGTGYISFRLAAEVPDGKVLAVDVQPQMIDLLEQSKAEGRINNVETVLGAADDPRLPPDSVDLALMVDAYHEFEFPREMMSGIVNALTPQGRVVLAEYRAENPLILIKGLHKMSQTQVKREMQAVGLSWVKTDERLPQQHLMFFEKR